jgi:hypothetical protein
MSAQLEVIAGADKGRIFPLALTPGAPLVLGRGRQSATRLNDPHVSRVHCQIEFRGDDLILKDLNSVGGTFVNDRAIGEHVLQSGDILRLGETLLRFERQDIADQQTLPPPQVQSPIPMSLPLDDPPPPPRWTPPPQAQPAIPMALPLDDPPAPPKRKTAPKPPLPSAPILDVLPAGSDDLPAAIPIDDDEPDIMPASPALKLLPGERLGELSGAVLGHYKLGEVLARGQSGVIFRAWDLKRPRDAAVKVLRPEFARDDVEVQRFIRSMKTTMPLRHPNLVSLYGAGKRGPYCWVAMEFIDGESLTQVIQRIGVAGMLDWRHAFRIAVHLGRALQFAHRKHIVHRNLTPQNVMIQHSDRAAKLGDLMLAKAIEGSMAQQITQSNEVLGDLRYMSPEQTFGPERLDARSDLYSLGAMLYAALTGQPPFEGDNLIETITKIRQAPVVMPKKFQMSIPDAFQSIVLRLLAKRPEDRYQSADEMLQELERVARYNGVTL